LFTDFNGERFIASSIESALKQTFFDTTFRPINMHSKPMNVDKDLSAFVQDITQGNHQS